MLPKIGVVKTTPFSANKIIPRTIPSCGIFFLIRAYVYGKKNPQTSGSAHACMLKFRFVKRILNPLTGQKRWRGPGAPPVAEGMARGER